MKITDMIISALLKKGVLYEARNCDVDLDVPMADSERFIHVNIKIEHMTLRIEKE